MQAQNKKQLIVLAPNNKTKEGEIETTSPDQYINVTEDAAGEITAISDPFAPMNKVLFHVNDKLYFGYSSL